MISVSLQLIHRNKKRVSTTLTCSQEKFENHVTLQLKNLLEFPRLFIARVIFDEFVCIWIVYIDSQFVFNCKVKKKWTFELPLRWLKNWKEKPVSMHFKKTVMLVPVIYLSLKLILFPYHNSHTQIGIQLIWLQSIIVNWRNKSLPVACDTYLFISPIFNVSPKKMSPILLQIVKQFLHCLQEAKIWFFFDTSTNNYIIV